MSLDPSDGLVRPLNAPSGQQVLPGVQPGVSGGVVLASYVIIFGTGPGGAQPGMFIYQGSPAPGNPPVYSISNGTQDPYGNAIAPGIWAGPFGGTQAGLEYNGTTGELLFPVGGTSPLLVGGIAGIAAGAGGSEVQVFSAQDASPNNDRAYGIFADHLAVGTSAAYFLGYQDALGVQNNHAVGGAAGLGLTAVSQLLGVLPGTGTSDTNQAQPETWHSATLINGWAGSGGVGGLFYTKIPIGPGGFVFMIGDIINAGGAPANSVCATLPSAYWPSATSQNHPTGRNDPLPNNSPTPPWVNYQTNGNVQITGLQAADSTKEVFFTLWAPLGTL